MRLGAKKSSYNKHRGFITKEGLFEPNIGFLGRISESLFGSTENDLENMAREHAVSNGPSRGSHQKLG